MAALEVVFWGSVLLLVYAYVGYPLLIALLARWRPRPIRKAAFTPNITIVIVAYNEAGRIERKLENCLSLDYPDERVAIVVISDGSTDDTVRRVERFANRGVRLYAFDQRRGKAACLNQAIAACHTDFVVLADTRQRFQAVAVRQLLMNFADETVAVVSGELVFEDDSPTGFSRGVDVYWRYEKFIRQQESAYGSVVGVTGAIYAIRRSAFQPIPEGVILDDVLIPMNAVQAGGRVVFESAAVAYDTPARDPDQERRRKIRTLAGNYQLLQTRPGLLIPWVNPLWWQLVSHKVLRLAAPFLMLMLLVSNLFLIGLSGLYAIFLSAQLAVYGLALVGSRVLPLRSCSFVRIPLTFCYLNWFAVLGLLEFLRNKRAHLW
jgi:cellulose synthase/poly-beta-1,6-N-acetylglucosamine synthase-like glycosyltransferase